MNNSILKGLLFVCVSTVSVSFSHAQNMTYTIAGGTSGNYGENVPAMMASLRSPSDVCIDQEGNIYFSESWGYRIRKIAAQTGLITTVAGTGSPGYSGDGGPATAAQLKFPGYICLDSHDNLYIVDGSMLGQAIGNHTIRKVDRITGIITTIAGISFNAGFSGDGGPAELAQLYNPREIVADANDNLYFVDKENYKIRKIDAQTGIITTVAGGGGHSYEGCPALSFALVAPAAIAVNAEGDVFFSDYYGQIIRRIDHVTQTITTIAGDAPSFLDSVPAVSSKIGSVYSMFCDGHGDLYITDISCSLHKIDMATGYIYKIAGDTILTGFNGEAGPSQDIWFSTPVGLAVNPASGDIIVADMQNHRIRKVTQPGYIPTAPQPNMVETVDGANLSIYPNPSSGTFTVRNTGAIKETILKVYNSIGAMVYSGMLKDRQQTIDITEQPSGIYHIVMTAEGKKQVQKMIISK